MEKHKAKTMSNFSKNFKMSATNAYSDAKPTLIFLKIKMHEKFIQICMIFSWKICTSADEAAKTIVFSYAKMMFFEHCFENDDFRHMFLHGTKINIAVFIKPTLRWPCKKLWRKCEIFNKKNSWHSISTVVPRFFHGHLAKKSYFGRCAFSYFCMHILFDFWDPVFAFWICIKIL